MDYQVSITRSDGTAENFTTTQDLAYRYVASEAKKPTPGITSVSIRAIVGQPVELTAEEAQALAMLVWRYMDPNTSYTAPDVEALHTASNKLVKAFE